MTFSNRPFRNSLLRSSVFRKRNTNRIPLYYLPFSLPSASPSPIPFFPTLIPFPRFSRIQPKLYCDSLHSLYQASQHAFFKKELQSKISEGQTFCQDFFRSLIAANDLSALIQQGISELDYLSFRANIYGVLANALEVVGLRLDGHRNVLYEVFRSFFSELRQTPMRNDFHVADQLIKRTNLTETELDECNRLFFHMRAFVKLSVVKHWSNYATVGRHSLGFVSGLVAIAIEVKSKIIPRFQCTLDGRKYDADSRL